MATNNQLLHEADLLKLNIDKAFHILNWKPSLSFYETIKLTAQWYKEFYENPKNIYNLSLDQIEFYENKTNNNL